jgi:hypothetical protein
LTQLPPGANTHSPRPRVSTFRGTRDELTEDPGEATGATVVGVKAVVAGATVVGGATVVDEANVVDGMAAVAEATVDADARVVDDPFPMEPPASTDTFVVTFVGPPKGEISTRTFEKIGP